jgi:hypothetical protein
MLIGIDGKHGDPRLATAEPNTPSSREVIFGRDRYVKAAEGYAERLRPSRQDPAGAEAVRTRSDRTAGIDHHRYEISRRLVLHNDSAVPVFTTYRKEEQKD